MMLLFLKKWWPVFAVLGLVGAFIAYGAYERQIGKRLTHTAVIAKQAEADKQIIKIKKEARHETQSKDRDALIRLHCSRGWVRNPEHCPK